jgi:aryl-alcohol dehydrogenase-like predicted oxidoreductase
MRLLAVDYGDRLRPFLLRVRPSGWARWPRAASNAHTWAGRAMRRYSREETMEALHDIVKAGKVRYIGASSRYAWQFAKLQHTAGMRGWTQFAAMQDQYNLLRRQDERELLPMCADMGVGAVRSSGSPKPGARAWLRLRWRGC